MYRGPSRKENDNTRIDSQPMVLSLHRSIYYTSCISILHIDIDIAKYKVLGAYLPHSISSNTVRYDKNEQINHPRHKYTHADTNTKLSRQKKNAKENEI